LEVLKNKAVGFAVAAVGIVVALVGLFADQLGIGGKGSDQIGGKQVAMLIFGLVIVAAGAAIVFMASSGTSSPSPSPAAPAEEPATEAE
jgi:nitrate/nitrite transporter NarK